MQHPSNNGHEHHDLTIAEVKGLRARPSANPAKAQKTFESIVRQTGNGSSLADLGARVHRFIRMTDGLWKINGRMPHIQDQLGLPYRNGLPKYVEGSGAYSTVNVHEEADISADEARQIMDEIRSERSELERVFRMYMDQPEGAEYIDAAETLADAVEKAYPRQYYG